MGSYAFEQQWCLQAAAGYASGRSYCSCECDYFSSWATDSKCERMDRGQVTGSGRSQHIECTRCTRRSGSCGVETQIIRSASSAFSASLRFIGAAANFYRGDAENAEEAQRRSRLKWLLSQLYAFKPHL